MAISPVSTGTALVPATYQARPAVSDSSAASSSTAQGGSAAASGSSVASTTSSTADASTIVSETTQTNSDGSVTIVITYKDGHSTTETVPGSIGAPSSQSLSGDLRSTNNGLGRLVNILV